jgi:hypothetical protein
MNMRSSTPFLRIYTEKTGAFAGVKIKQRVMLQRV